MRLDSSTCRERLSAARSAYLATTGGDLAPHIVPIAFAVLGDRIVTAVDRKPKSTTALRRLRNIAENPRVAVLRDHYSDDWDRLWWVRADGTADVVDDGPEWYDGVAALTARYPQYADAPPHGPLIRITTTRWTGWAHTA
ncbi:TIGR03668 family PPOX class F420-dependent oxidoreductase [Myceligenerans pegani]|uniref:TIGR03668 family PPOX class F420-dependent oxidoreductase n=1 Tax=Myceligenerans pegani TaxID=2776917 RepID=A0ABR9MXU9_9MICO|nr:TIGR03668 family PPOX class F420-dependent oxidoreductase [Myceligenerans sp. TRM 65318]MBE1876212.1 TIGR03668 family PPOX class F420-dependent oxidoreductase [Myceligenerans sp. TRM 65318]MBE3018483.1 TIGR03668 family PPOX class F420-dependent oxidoreductase [Myceligenerans sp. TRM 65318]